MKDDRAGALPQFSWRPEKFRLKLFFYTSSLTGSRHAVEAAGGPLLKENFGRSRPRIAVLKGARRRL